MSCEDYNPSFTMPKDCATFNCQFTANNHESDPIICDFSKSIRSWFDIIYGMDKPNLQVVCK